MRLTYDINALALIIDDQAVASWLNGAAIYYKIPRDSRPDEFNPYETDTNATDRYYNLEKLVDRTTSAELNEELNKLATIP